MDPTTTESPPGCLVILIPLSAGMAEDVRVQLAHRFTPEGEPDIRDLPKSFVARFLADELLDGLVNALVAGYPIPLEVAVLGYNANGDGNLKLVSLLPDGNPESRFIPLADVANLPAEPRTLEGDPRKWIAATPCEGTAPAAKALAEIYRLVSIWLTGRFAAKPPVVIHCTDGEGLDETYARMARSLGLLATAYGPVRLLHYGFTAGFEPVLSGLWPDPVPEPWAGLLELSAELPAEPEGRAARRAVSVNDWTVADPWSAIFDLTPVENTVPWTAPEEGRFFPTVRQMWTQKMGNKPEEWEDAYATDSATGAVVVADGASSGIYCRIWADQLSKRFITDRPDPLDWRAFGKWIHGLRGEWRTAINYPTLNWAKQRKVDEVGAAATFLALEVGPVDAVGNRPWRACAVGDASLFWVRNGQLQASFPVVAYDQFGSAPLLIRSNPGFKTLALIASGVCQPGDRFLLATDAVAARLLKSAASGPGPDWERFETIEEEEWRKELDVLRQAHDMVNDDCTLVALQVAGESPPAEVPATWVAAAEMDSEPQPEPAEPTGFQMPAIPMEPSPIPNEAPAATNHIPEPPPDRDFRSGSHPASVEDGGSDLPSEPNRLHPRGEENGPAHPTPEREQPNTRDGFPESTDNTTV
ncbi:MAG TPA: hypothetical protein VG122_07850 [Gemmata sp.]|jgi:hypothetical protein|nr:hypothetical protein [Gemmata sp.]